MARHRLRHRYGRAEGKHLGGFFKGDRVQLHPGTDRWMMGDRYGDVVKVGREKLHVKMDRSGQTLKIRPHNLQRVD